MHSELFVFIFCELERVAPIVLILLTPSTLWKPFLNPRFSNYQTPDVSVVFVSSQDKVGSFPDLYFHASPLKARVIISLFKKLYRSCFFKNWFWIWHSSFHHVYDNYLNWTLYVYMVSIYTACFSGFSDYPKTQWLRTIIIYYLLQFLCIRNLHRVQAGRLVSLPHYLRPQQEDSTAQVSSVALAFWRLVHLRLVLAVSPLGAWLGLLTSTPTHELVCRHAFLTV